VIHEQVEYSVEDPHGQERIFKDPKEAQLFVPKGTTGTVSDSCKDGVLVKVDGRVPGLTDSDEWEGEFQWLDAHVEAGEPECREDRQPAILARALAARAT
jgi:hypothetical protein